MASSSSPIIVITEAFEHRDIFFECVEYREDNGETQNSFELGENRIDCYQSKHPSGGGGGGQHRPSVFSCTVRVPGGKAGFLQELNHITPHYKTVLVLHSLLDQHDINRHNHHANGTVHINPALQVIEHIFHETLSDRNRADYARLLGRLRGRNGGPFILQSDFQQRAITEFLALQNTALPRPYLRRRLVFRNDEAATAAAVMSLDDIFEPAAPWNNAEGVDDDDESAQLERARQLSLEVAEREQQAAAQVRVRLREGWDQVLREKSETLAVGDPVCVVCLSNRAAICLVECGHQVMCDECVRVMFSRVDVAHKCPVCSAECHIIARPILSKTAAEEDVREAPIQSRRQKVKRVKKNQ